MVYQFITNNTVASKCSKNRLTVWQVLEPFLERSWEISWSCYKFFGKLGTPSPLKMTSFSLEDRAFCSKDPLFQFCKPQILCFKGAAKNPPLEFFFLQWVCQPMHTAVATHYPILGPKHTPFHST